MIDSKQSPDGMLREYAWNWLIASRIMDRLLSLGLDAELLVPEETDISLRERCRRVNTWCRQVGKDNVILISIHANAAGHGDRWYDATGWSAYDFVGPTAPPPTPGGGRRDFSTRLARSK